MEKFFIILISILTIIITYKAYTLLNGRIKIFTITSFFYFSFIVYAYIGSVLLNIIEFDYEKRLGFYYLPNLIFSQWQLLSISLITLIFGFWIAKVFFGLSNLSKINRIAINNNINYPSPKEQKALFKIIIILFSFAIICLIVYRNMLGFLPIESIFSNSINNKVLSILRSDATNNFSGKLYRYRFLIETMPLLLFIIVSFLKDIGKYKWKFLYICLLIYNIFTSLMTLQKAPIIKFLLIISLIYFINNKIISKKTLFKLSLVIVPLIIFMYYFFMGQNDVPFISIMEMATHRIFLGSVEPLFWYLKYVEEYGLLYGLSFPNPAGIFPFEHFPLTVEISKYAGYTQLGSGIVGSMPTIFIGEWYVNFGTYGVIIGSMIFGFIIQTFDIFAMTALSKEKNIINLSIFVYYINFFSKYAETGMTVIFFDPELYLPILFIVIYKLFTRKFKYEYS